jgi:hypothetical protein
MSTNFIVLAPPIDGAPPAELTPTPPDSITILVAKGQKILTKRWTRFAQGPPKETAYDRATWFCASEHPVSNIRGLGAAISEISADPRAAIVRGAVAPGANRRHMLRRALPRGDVPATLVPTPRRWVGLDIENIACPPEIDPVFEPDAVVEHVISLLPAAFHEATCYWHFSSGHGIKPDVRIRMWFWLDRPVADHELKRWLGERVPADGVPPDKWEQRWKIDTSLFNPIQLHYTATPIFDGMTDPLPYRSGWRKGVDDVVMMPELQAEQPRSTVSSTDGSRLWPGLGYRGYRAQIGIGDNGFWKPIKSSLGAYFGSRGSTADIEWVIADLAAVIYERQGERQDSYISDRLRDLPNLAAWVRDQQAAKEVEDADRACQVTRIDGDAAGPLLIAVQVEDANAGCSATGYEGRACAAGLFEEALDDVPADRIVVVLQTDEGRFSSARQAELKTMRRWQSDPRKVLRAMPRLLSQGDNYAFADLMRSAGPHAVKARIEAALTPRALPRRLPVDDARRALGVIIDRVFDDRVATPSAVG